MGWFLFPFFSVRVARILEESHRALKQLWKMQLLKVGSLALKACFPRIHQYRDVKKVDTPYPEASRGSEIRGESRIAILGQLSP